MYVHGRARRDFVYHGLAGLEFGIGFVIMNANLQSNNSEDFFGEPKVMEPDEITEWQWFDLDNLPSPLFFPSAKVLENYKQKKFYIFNN